MTHADRPARTRALRRRRPVLGVLGIVLAGAALLAPSAAWAETAPPDDPNLKQTLSPDLAIVHGERVLETGHVDMGPKFEKDGTWRFLIHDDVARADADAKSVWRYPDETVFHVVDAAELTVPDDEAYSFLGADPGETVWVVPQTQNPDVVWLGWNTQDPDVMKTIDRGITLSLTGVQGPGVVTTYLQSGSFGAPQVLWDSRKTDAQPVWVDVNTHTHANWVFTKPGVYLLRLTAEADLVDGSHASDTQLIRFAVGTATSPAEAMAATWQGEDDPTSTAPASAGATAGSTQDATAPANRDTDSSGPLVPVLIGAIIVVAVGLVTGFAIAIARGNQARRRILAARTGDRGSPDEPGSTADPGQAPGPDPGRDGSRGGDA
ncbi:choice-of-anchor M domain-containing protein [Propionicicella superfundia]|uniref:choice-of-anchor M domain-containing protein n=1 Tax=Propionicicella superfundia TaxID=348582 RepID=UPI0009FE00B9|nr:choice-of-anchor M domain-containing protein [Propionicicella superfundia]